MHTLGSNDERPCSWPGTRAYRWRRTPVDQIKRMQSCASSAEGGPDAGSRRIEYSSLEGVEIENSLQLSDNSWSALKLTRAIEEARVDGSLACRAETEQHCPGVQQSLQLSVRQNEEPPRIEHFWKANTSDRGAKRNAINKNTSALWRPSFTDNL